jgi:hypothetical protein
MSAPTIIELRPHRWGWKVFECPGVEPVFSEQRQAIDYAQSRTATRSGEIRVLGPDNRIIETIPFSNSNRAL